MPSLLTRLFRRDEAPSRSKSIAMSQAAWESALRGDNDAVSRALRVATVYACVRVIAETIASLPVGLFQRLDDGGKRRILDSELLDLVRYTPNRYQTSFEWREQIMSHLLLRGNAYIEIVRRDRDGRPLELNVLNPDDMTVTGGEYGAVYTYKPSASGEKVFKQDSPTQPKPILHFKGLSMDSLLGRSVIGDAADTFFAASAAQQYGRRVLENDATPGLVIKHPEVLDEESAVRLRESWQAAFRGPANAGRTAVLEQGMSIEKVSMTAEDMQFLDSRRFLRTEIASIFRVPPHMVGDLDRATFSNIEQQGIDFVTHTIRPWIVRLEMSLNQSLLSPSERRTQFFEFNLDGLMRGDLQSRYMAYMTGRQAGFLSVNEIRRWENLDPIGERGDVFLEPLNMQEVGGGNVSGR